MPPQLASRPLDPNDPELLRLIEQYEGRVPYTYRDDLGNVTVGIGQLLAAPAAAELLPFEHDGFGLGPLASTEEKGAAWARVKHARFGTTHAEFRQLGGLVLSSEYISVLARRQIAEFIKELQGAFSDFDTFPRDAQIALLDIAFNTGSVRPKQWPLLTAAIRRRDWREAAIQSHRRTAEVGVDRNEFTRRHCLSAAATDSIARTPAPVPR